MRLYGNINKTEPDAFGILTMRKTALTLRGAEGVRNKDINAYCHGKNDPATNSRFQLRL